MKDIIKHLFRFLLLILILVLCWFLGKYFSSDIKYYKELISGFPIYLKGLAFVFLYSGVTFFAWLTKDLFKIVGAVLFGAYLSTLFIWIAEIINAAVLFHLSRKLGRGFVESIIKGIIGDSDKKIQRGGFWGVFTLRIVPLVPYRFLDLIVGLTNISFKSYLIAVIVASPLRIFWIQFVLAGVGDKLIENPNIVEFFQAFIDYFLENVFIFYFTFGYIIAAIILMWWLKRKVDI